MSLLRLIVLRRVLRFYRLLVSIVQASGIFKYILAILTAVGSQWPIGICLRTLFSVSFWFDVVRVGYPSFCSHVNYFRSSRVQCN
jgi:hypothetical protein